MSRQNRLLLLSCSLLLSAMVVAEAEAQGLPPPFIEYAAKFTCGRVPPAGPAGGGDTDAVVGVYATSINIHNPQAETPITFFKKIVIANQEGQTPGQIFVLKATETLGPDRAERVDCPLIFRLPGITPGTHVEGFVVLEIAVNPNQPQVSLDVVGTYSARAFTGEASSLDMVVYNPKEITR